MKRLPVIVCLVVLSLSLPVVASEAFTLTIPLGEDNTRQIGEVRIILGLSAPPAGAQLVVGGTTTLNLGQTMTVDGDSVSFEAGAGNAARITYRPLSNFPTANNFCTFDLNATPTEVQMRFVGPQDILDYRISSYRVGAPAVECSQVFQRAGDFPAFIT